MLGVACEVLALAPGESCCNEKCRRSSGGTLEPLHKDLCVLRAQG
jgi:hypothetical protein